jgi:hypothetical protein
VAVNKLALGTILIAMARFGAGPQEIIERLQEMHWYSEEQANYVLARKATFPRDLAFAMRFFSQLDAACQVSLIAYSVDHVEHPNATQQREVSKLLFKIPQIGIALSANERPAPEHVGRPDARFAPRRKVNVNEVVPAYSWDSRSLYDYELQETILKRLRTICTVGTL